MASKLSIYQYLAILVALLWTLFPIYWVLRLAFMTSAEISAYPPHFFPPNPQPGSFFNIIGFPYETAEGLTLNPSGQAKQILFGLKNSLIVAIFTTFLTLVVIVPLSYVFARLQFAFKNTILMTILFSVAIPPVSTLIPFYILFVKLGLTGTHVGLILITLTLTIPFVTWMLIGYFKNLPHVERLARMDGFSRMQTFFVIILPIARNGIIIAAVISFLFSWNEFVFATILVNGTDASTLPAAISGFLFQQPHPGHLAAAIWVAILPAALVVYFLQRNITQMDLLKTIH